MMVFAILFVVFTAILCAVAVLALLGLGHLALSGSDALERDGLARGGPAPAWTLADTEGIQRRSPPGRPLQLIVFADHSLKSFPAVVAGLRAQRDDQADLEIVILTRGAAENSQPVLHQIGLDGIPVVTGSPARYAAYNVRVMPFAIFVDAQGRVRASSLVNHDWQLAKLRQVAAIPLDDGDLAAPGRPGAVVVPRRRFRAAV
jgi:hypothetical protein